MNPNHPDLGIMSITIGSLALRIRAGTTTPSPSNLLPDGPDIWNFTWRENAVLANGTLKRNNKKEKRADNA